MQFNFCSARALFLHEQWFIKQFIYVRVTKDCRAVYQNSLCIYHVLRRNLNSFNTLKKGSNKASKYKLDNSCMCDVNIWYHEVLEHLNYTLQFHQNRIYWLNCDFYYILRLMNIFSYMYNVSLSHFYYEIVLR